MSHWDNGDEPVSDRDQASYRPEHEPGHPGEGPVFYGPPGHDARTGDSWYGAGEPDSGPSGRADAQQDPGPPDGAWSGYGEYMPEHAPEQDEYPPPGWGTDPPARYRPHGRTRGRRWRAGAAAAVLACLLAGAVVAIRGGSTARVTPDSNAGTAGGGSAVSAAGGTTAASPAQAPPVITRAQAQQVLARYTTLDNEANLARSNALLAGIEAGSSYPMDTGTYRGERSADPSNSKYTPISYQQAVYDIPRMAASAYPKWFVARALNHSAGAPSVFEYLVFAQTAAGTPWRDIDEPFILSHVVVPQIAVDAQGYAITTDTTAGTAGLSVAPGQVENVTAAYLDQAGASLVNREVMASGYQYLYDMHDEVFFRSHGVSATTDRHSAAPYPVLGLKTRNGGSLIFYTLDAQLSLTAPPGAYLSISIPGYVSPKETPTSARFGYIEQFATYIPPAGLGDRRIVADFSSIASRG